MVRRIESVKMAPDNEEKIIITRKLIGHLRIINILIMKRRWFYQANNEEKMIITRAPSRNRTFKDEESDLCFGNVVLDSYQQPKQSRDYWVCKLFFEHLVCKITTQATSEHRFFNYMHLSKLTPSTSLRIRSNSLLLAAHGQYHLIPNLLQINWNWTCTQHFQ